MSANTPVPLLLEPRQLLIGICFLDAARFNQFIQGSASNATLTIGTAREGVILRAITGSIGTIGGAPDQVILTITYRGQVLTIGSRDQITANLSQTFTFMEGASAMAGVAPGANYNLLGVLPPGMIFIDRNLLSGRCAVQSWVSALISRNPALTSLELGQ